MRPGSAVSNVRYRFASMMARACAASLLRDGTAERTACSAVSCQRCALLAADLIETVPLTGARMYILAVIVLSTWTWFEARAVSCEESNRSKTALVIKSQ
jgi:hypothetical protein